MIIHIMGASGSGTSTLGKFLAKKLNFSLIESDFYKWEQTDPPFQIMRDNEVSNRLLMEEILKNENLIISGSLHSNPVIFPYIDLIIYLTCPTKVRLKRVIDRDIELGRNSLEAEGEVYENFLGFLDLVKNYNKKDLTCRSKASQKYVMKECAVPVIRINTNKAINKVRRNILRKLKKYL